MSDVKVTYDFDHGKIDVDVLVEEEENGNLLITAALPTLLRGRWTVTWNLKAGANITQLTFDPTDGIKIIADPPELTVGASALGDNPDLRSWTISFTNSCESANIAKYDIIGKANERPFRHELDANVRFHHDPTIAVASDPITG